MRRKCFINAFDLKLYWVHTFRTSLSEDIGKKQKKFEVDINGS
jgi:hypothetical protein